jgi:DNA replication protein DnaD
MMVRIIMSQTDMSHDEVISALERTQYNLKQVIREYMTSGSASGSASGAAAVSTNQLRFSEIRNFMDKSAETFRRNQEMTRIYQQVMEKKKQQAATAPAAAEQGGAFAVSKL